MSEYISNKKCHPSPVKSKSFLEWVFIPYNGSTGFNNKSHHIRGVYGFY